MELSKKEINAIQGVSVLAMVCLHLFCRNDLSEVCTPLIYMNNIPLAYYFGQLADFCVFGFAFCSGYAHNILFHMDEKYYKNRLKSLFKLFINYWLVIIIFSFIGVVTNSTEIPGTAVEFLGNFFLYNMTYNGAWWYMLTYLLIVITSGLVIKIVNKYPIKSIIVLTLIYIISYIIRFKYSFDNFFIIQSYLYGMTIFEYSIGIFFNKYEIFTKIKNILKNTNSKLISSCFILIFIILLVCRTLVVRSLIVAPLSGILVIIIFNYFYNKISIFKIFDFIGKHSTNIWLTHMFFYIGLFPEFIYIAKFPVLIILLMLIITICFSYIILFVKNFIINKIVVI